MTQPQTAEDVEAARVAEYGQYVAKDVIYIGAARAFNAGDPVPTSHVERKVVSPEQVEKVEKVSPAAPAATDKSKGDK